MRRLRTAGRRHTAITPAVLVVLVVLAVAALAGAGSVAGAFVLPPGTNYHQAIYCMGGYKPGMACEVPAPQVVPCPSDPTGCNQAVGTAVPFIHDGGLLAAQYPAAVPGHRVELEYYNEGCGPSVPQTVWADEGPSFASNTLRVIGVIPRTPVDRSRALGFALPTNLLGLFVSLGAPAARGTCYPPVQGVWLVIGRDSCPLPAGRHAQAAEACCPTPTLTATARVSHTGRDVIGTLTARGLGPQSRCGRAKLSADHMRIDTLRETASSATGTVRLTGNRSCISTLKAGVTQSSASATDNATVIGGKPSFRLARAMRTSAGAIQLLVKVDDLRPRDVCGTPTITATVAHASRAAVSLTVLPSSATAVTARATLSGREKCATLLQIRVQQDRIDDQIPAPAVSGTIPSGCQINPP